MGQAQGNRLNFLDIIIQRAGNNPIYGYIRTRKQHHQTQ
jgi:hypothetical protein